MHRATQLTAIALLSVIFVSLSAYIPALAQAGSTGGTVGRLINQFQASGRKKNLHTADLGTEIMSLNRRDTQDPRYFRIRYCTGPGWTGV